MGKNDETIDKMHARKDLWVAAIAAAKSQTKSDDRDVDEREEVYDQVPGSESTDALIQWFINHQISQKNKYTLSRIKHAITSTQ